MYVNFSNIVIRDLNCFRRDAMKEYTEVQFELKSLSNFIAIIEGEGEVVTNLGITYKQ